MPDADPPSQELAATIVDRKGRSVLVTHERCRHIAEGHPEVRLPDVICAVERAEVGTTGRTTDDERLWARDIGPARWFVVVVAYSGRVGRVKTAYASTKGPRAEQRL